MGACLWFISSAGQLGTGAETAAPSAPQVPQDCGGGGQALPGGRTSCSRVLPGP